MSACATPSETVTNAARFSAPEGLNGLRLECDDRCVSLELPDVWLTCSNAPLGGGLAAARRLFILKVDANREGRQDGFAPPERTLADHARKQGWKGPWVGFMTAASMGSFRAAWQSRGELTVLAGATTGLTNARRAGDPSDWPVPDRPPPQGTINILVATNARLPDAAMLEALMIAAEAKAAVLHDLGIESPLSGLPATGTGTDCAVVASGPGPVHHYCGKHVPLGEMLARTVMAALRASIGRRG